MKDKAQSILKGSLILLIANFTVKLIGAAFKIPLTNLIGNEGMGYFNSAYSIYSGLFVIATAGLPVAVSKMISESVAENRLRDTKRIFSIAYIMFLIIGIIGTSALFFGADAYASTTKYTDANIAIRTIAPAILLVSLMSVYRGFFQGMRNMYPTAISEVIEALGKLLIGYIAAYLLLGKGLHMAAAGAIFGVTAGAFLALAVIMLIYRNNKKQIYIGIENAPQSRSTKHITLKLLKIAIPVTISASVFTLTNLIDSIFIGRNLESIKHFLIDTPLMRQVISETPEYLTDPDLINRVHTILYGIYTGKAVVLYNMPPTLVMALCMSLVPAISRAVAQKDSLLIKSTTTQSLRMVMMFAVPCSVGLLVFAEPILMLLYGTTDATLLLQLLSFAVTFVSMVLVTNSILQATGHVMVPVANIAISGIVKLIINTSLVSNPAININGAPIGTTACYFTYMALNLIYIRKITKADIGLGFWIKPIVSGFAMAAFGWIANEVLSSIIGIDSRFGAAVCFVTCGAISGIAYFAAMFIVGGIKKSDIVVLPKGEKIADLLSRMKLLK